MHVETTLNWIHDFPTLIKQGRPEPGFRRFATKQRFQLVLIVDPFKALPLFTRRAVLSWFPTTPPPKYL